MKAIHKHMQIIEGRKDEIHVTDINGCLRKAFYSKTTEQIPYPHEQIVLMVGTAVHEYVENAMEGDQNFQVEVPIGDQIAGRVDMLNNDQIIDLKTTRWLSKSKGLPYGDHANQVGMYSVILGGDRRLFIQYLDVSGPTTCYSCRVPYRVEDGEYKCPSCGGYPKNEPHLGALLYEVEPPGDLAYDSMMLRHKLLEMALETNSPPEPEPSWICKYCPFSQCPENPRK